MMHCNLVVDALASFAYPFSHVERGRAVPIDYVTPKYRLAEAARAAGVPLNTLRSYYGRGDFRIIGGEDKKGRGVAALLTLPDVLCIAVACELVGVGVRAKLAFEIAISFAYEGDADRLPAQLCKSQPFTVLICYPPDSLFSRIIGMRDSISFADLFWAMGSSGRLTPVVMLLNDIERRVFWALHVGAPEFDKHPSEDANGN